MTARHNINYVRPSYGRAQEGILRSQSGSPDHKSGLNWPKTSLPKKNSLSALAGDLLADTLAINNSILLDNPK